RPERLPDLRERRSRHDGVASSCAGLDARIGRVGLLTGVADRRSETVEDRPALGDVVRVREAGVPRRPGKAPVVLRLPADGAEGTERVDLLRDERLPLVGRDPGVAVASTAPPARA